MHVWSVCLWAKSLFLGFFRTFSATTTHLKKRKKRKTAVLVTMHRRGDRTAKIHGALFTASPRVKWRAGFEECR